MTKPTRDDLLSTIREIADKAVPKVAQRNAAYAGSGDVFGNLNLVETLSNGKLSTELGITLRMGDKVSRLFSLCSDPTIPVGDETLEDTLIDLLGYSALLLLRARTRTSPPTKKTSPEDVPALITQTIKDFRKENPGMLEEFVHRLPISVPGHDKMPPTYPGTQSTIIPGAESPPMMSREEFNALQVQLDPKEFQVEHAGTPTTTPIWERHDFAWDGTLPCTGSYRCLFCKKVADATATDYSKVDYTERCPARTKCTNP